MSPTLKPRPSIFNARTLTAPFAALTMAFLLYTYSVTSIRAAKRNAKLHREADGGQLDMRRESLRRHGVLEKVGGTGGVELFRNAGGKDERGRGGKEAVIGEMKGEDGQQQQQQKMGRTKVEERLEGYKGRGRAVEKFRDERPSLPEED